MNSYLTFCTIVRNEANNIRRILDIGKSLCIDMVVAVQEGEDDTLKIVKEYTNNVIVRPPEPPEMSRDFVMEKVNTEWTFWLDADEVPSYELCKWVENFTPPKDIDAIRIARYNYINGLRIEVNEGKDMQFRMVRKDVRWSIDKQHQKCHIYPIVYNWIAVELPIYHHRTLEKIERTTKRWNELEPKTEKMCNDYLERVKESLSNSTK